MDNPLEYTVHYCYKTITSKIPTLDTLLLAQEFPNKGPMMQKSYICHDIIMGDFDFNFEVNWFQSKLQEN